MDSPEPTARDPFTQLDRRMSRLEDDFREFRRFVEERLAAMERKFETRFEALEKRFETMEGRRRSDIRWLTGMLFASWMSTMATLLLR